ncbi:hypothetical protein MAR_012587 [Mya arenaria]|uniref:Uncharacterized protein n=1 Tax=Mya arenaria TaxID=6604 RepID=A0ABY7FXE5_MYAAR|nr:hypothetical protein MAR_012587 [Mya arenaria]
MDIHLSCVFGVVASYPVVVVHASSAVVFAAAKTPMSIRPLPAILLLFLKLLTAQLQSPCETCIGELHSSCSPLPWLPGDQPALLKLAFLLLTADCSCRPVLVVALQIQPMAEITHTQVAVLQIHQMAEFIHIKVAVSHIYSLPEVVQTGGRFVHSPNGRGHTNNWQFRTFVRWSGQTPRWPFRIYTRWPRSNKKMAAQHIHQGNKQNMLFVNSDVYVQLRPRNVDRKERHPGARERNSNKRQRLQDKRKIPPENAPRSRATEPQFHTTYSHDSAVKDFGRHETCSEQNEQQRVTSYYQKLSTIEAIRKSIDKTSRTKSATSANIPNWMLNLDINLDVSSVDIIPPYDDDVTLKSRASETFSERASLTFVENNSEDNIDNLSDSEKDYLEAVPNENKHQEKAKSVPIPDNKKREVYADTSVWPRQNKSVRPLSNTFRIATPFSAGWTNTEDTGPRRYQGDKKVMSMQQGGIRSTPMQPKSKKYINQMLTFHHMKHHEKKIRLAKHRKRLVDVSLR